ncbi:MAG: rRNA pseudouridine synthase [Planctomycetales bacterium]
MSKITLWTTAGVIKTVGHLNGHTILDNPALPVILVGSTILQESATMPRDNKAKSPVAGPERLQKVLAAAGIASRRECEQLILEGRVEVDRKVVTRLGTKVDLDSQEIQVDGDVLTSTKRLYYIVNKPKGVLSTHSDPAGRGRVIDLVPNATRLFTVGRLDMDSQGLVLVTNDGELANRLAHPRYGVEKTYHVQVAGSPNRSVLQNLRDGVRLAEARVRAVAVRVKKTLKQSTVLEIVLRDGKNREIRRMLAAVGHKVQQLKRTAIGPIRIGTLPLGEFRELTRREVTELQKTGGNSQRPKKTDIKKTATKKTKKRVKRKQARKRQR